MNSNIFTSYSRRDTRTVNRVVDELAKYGYQAWLDTRNIRGGKRWREAINTAIANSNIFLFFISAASIKSLNVRQELDLAVSRGNKIRIIPILLEEVDIPNDLKFPVAEVQWVELKGDFHDTIKRLLVAFGDDGEIKIAKASRNKAASISLPVGNRDIEDLVQAVERIINLVSTGQYTRAVSEGAKIRETLSQITDPNNVDRILLQGGLDVWYAHALLYAGKTESATNLLNDLIEKFEKLSSSSGHIEKNSRFLGILGRAHNHLGYINWMNLGHYEEALSEFRKSIRFFLLGGKSLQRELATAYDNMGRVYAQLGFRPRAILLIEHGKCLRESSNDWDRLGLSLTSNAIAHLEFGQPHQALQSSESACAIFGERSSVIGERGIGLALLTKAQSVRNIGLQAYHLGQIDIALKQIEMALPTLKRAEKVFLRVGEEVRLFQIYNELGCAYRDRALFLKQAGENDKSFGSMDLAIQFLEKSIRITKGSAHGYKYHSYFLDACEDMAQVYFINGNNKKAREWLDRAEQSVPEHYRLTNTAKPKEILADECSEEFWQQLGKIYFLRGQMLLDTSSFVGYQKRGLSPSLQRGIEDHIIAAAYFGRFTERPLDIDNISLYPRYRSELKNQWKLANGIYKILSALQVDDLKKIEEQIMPKLCTVYDLKSSWLELFNEDGLNFLLSINRQFTIE